jgi:3-oxoacyl-(acyl-carrier-protein) synthase
VEDVAVTGLGLLSGLGRGTDAHAGALERGASGLGRLTLFTLEGIAQSPVGQVDPAHLEPGLSRSCALALAAAADALAGATPRGEGLLALGITTGGIFESEQHYRKHRGRAGEPDRELLKRHDAGTVLDTLARRLHLSGERQTFSTACSSSANAIGYAAARVADGLPWALAGGVDSLCRLTYGGFHALKLLAPEPCRPFDAHRHGLNLGEGAAFLLLEPAGLTARRPLARVRGWGCTSDAYHMTAPHPEGDGAYRAMVAALADAGLSPAEVDYVNAHGTATPANDAAEGKALARLFGERTPWVSSTKGATGHTLGAAGALEAALCVLCLERGLYPPTRGLTEADPTIAVRHVPKEGRRAPLRVALSNSFGFGGNNAALVLSGGA